MKTAYLFINVVRMDRNWNTPVSLIGTYNETMGDLGAAFLGMYTRQRKFYIHTKTCT